MPKNKKKPPAPVTPGNVVASFMSEMTSCMQELKARREFDDDFAAFVKTKPGLATEFESFRDRRLSDA